MTYQPQIPQDIPAPASIVSQIQTNFSQYATIFSGNHIALNDTNQGKHSNVIFQSQSVDPGVNNDYVCLYCKPVTNTISSNFNQLFLQIPQFVQNQSNFPQQLTYNQVNTSGPQYQSFLPGGYILYQGSVSSVPATITLSPTCSKILSVVVTPHSLSGGSGTLPIFGAANITSANTFVINGARVGSYSFTYTAIGAQ